MLGQLVPPLLDHDHGGRQLPRRRGQVQARLQPALVRRTPNVSMLTVGPRLARDEMRVAEARLGNYSLQRSRQLQTRRPIAACSQVRELSDRPPLRKQLRLASTAA